jgi:hypothetical protein
VSERNAIQVEFYLGGTKKQTTKQKKYPKKVAHLNYFVFLSVGVAILMSTHIQFDKSLVVTRNYSTDVQPFDRPEKIRALHGHAH